MPSSVGSAPDWEALIVEGNIDRRIAFIVSEETKGDLKVSLFILNNADDEDDYVYTRNQPFRTVGLIDLIEELREAASKLR